MISQNIRRRFFGVLGANYVFSASTTSKSVSYWSSSFNISITSTKNDSTIGFEVYGYDGCVTGVTISSTNITVSYGENTTFSTRQGSVVLKQTESNKIITITVIQEALTVNVDFYNLILDGSGGSTCKTYINVSEGGTVLSKPDWVSITCSDYYINVTALSSNDSTSYRYEEATIDFGEQTVNLYIHQMPNSYNIVDGHEYVTLYGYKWAIKNVGANTPYDVGNYYQWGAGSNVFVANEKQWLSGNVDISGTEYDTARQVMGGGWRMPTVTEIDTLNNTWYSRAVYNDVPGYIFRGTSNIDPGNCIFIAGNTALYYNGATIYDGKVWTSSPRGSDDLAYYFTLRRDEDFARSDWWNLYHRYDGFLVRGIHD